MTSAGSGIDQSATSIQILPKQSRSEFLMTSHVRSPLWTLCRQHGLGYSQLYKDHLFCLFSVKMVGVPGFTSVQILAATALLEPITTCSISDIRIWGLPIENRKSHLRNISATAGFKRMHFWITRPACYPLIQLGSSHELCLWMPLWNNLAFCLNAV